MFILLQAYLYVRALEFGLSGYHIRVVHYDPFNNSGVIDVANESDPFGLKFGGAVFKQHGSRSEFELFEVICEDGDLDSGLKGAVGVNDKRVFGDAFSRLSDDRDLHSHGFGGSAYDLYGELRSLCGRKDGDLFGQELTRRRLNNELFGDLLFGSDISQGYAGFVNNEVIHYVDASGEGDESARCALHGDVEEFISFKAFEVPDSLQICFLAGRKVCGGQVHCRACTRDRSEAQFYFFLRDVSYFEDVFEGIYGPVASSKVDKGLVTSYGAADRCWVFRAGLV